MYLSRLTLDLGDNPDHPRPGRIWLRNLYHVHQRLCMAFPSAYRKIEDPEFLKPYNPIDFGKEHVHIKRDSVSGFLFRIDPRSQSRALIIVQSASDPDWDYAFHNASYFLAAPPEKKVYNPSITKGQRMRFRLLANPTRRLSKNSPGIKSEFIGMRVPVPSDRLIEWITRKAESSGFSLEKDSMNIQPDYFFFKKPNVKEGQRMFSVRFDGELTVSKPEIFKISIFQGIGSGKAFGLGLLSVSPINGSFER